VGTLELSKIKHDYIQLNERDLRKLREEVNACKMVQNNKVNTLNQQNEQDSHIEQILTLQKFTKFSGSTDEDFSIRFDDFIEIIKISNLTEREKINKFKTFLSGEARYNLEEFNHDVIGTLEEAGNQMKNVFDYANDTQDLLVKLNEVKKTTIEPIRVFAYRVNRMVKKAFPDAGEIS
jgi:hypothetical protein